MKNNKDADASRLPAPRRNAEARTGTAAALKAHTDTGSRRHDNSPLLFCEQPPARKNSQAAEVTDPRHPQCVYCYLMEGRHLLTLNFFCLVSLFQTKLNCDTAQSDLPGVGPAVQDARSKN